MRKAQGSTAIVHALEGLQTMVEIVARYWPAIISGSFVTIKLWLVVMIFGIFIGTTIGWFADESKGFRLIEQCGRWLLAIVPPLVLIMWCFYPLQRIFQVSLSPFVSAAIALSVLNIFSVANIVRSSRRSVPSDLAALPSMYGAHRLVSIFVIEAPLVVQSALGPLISLQIIMLHSTLLGSFIGVEEILRVVSQINAIEYAPIESYSILALIFVAMCFPLNFFYYLVQRKCSLNRRKA